MMKATFPEIYRYWKVEASRVRLIAGFLTVNVIGLCVYLLARQSSDPGKQLYDTMLWMQAALLLLYGTLRTSGSIAAERAQKTWDLQRMTPLTSFEIATGKLIGTPIFAYFLFVVSLLWTFVGLFQSGSVGIRGAALAYALLGSTALLFLNAGLLVSAHSAGDRGNTVNIGGVLLGIYGVGLFMKALPTSGPSSAMTAFYGVKVSQTFFILGSCLVFGAWSFAGACWRLGQDLLEKKHFWRLPAFLIFLAFYVLGFNYDSDIMNSKHDFAVYLSLLVGSLFVRIAALLTKEGSDTWRRWLSYRGGKKWLDETPLWIRGYLTILAMGFGMGLLFVLKNEIQSGTVYVLILTLLFLARDLCFIQWCRSTQSRRPEMMAIVYLCLAYVLPVLLLRSFNVSEMNFLFAPLLSAKPEYGWHVLPALLQTIVMAALLFSRLEKPKPSQESVTS